MQCVAVWCSVMQSDAVWFSVMQCVRCSVTPYGAVCCSVLQRVAARCSMMQNVAARCSVMQCVAVWRSVLKCDAVWRNVIQCIPVHCSVLQCVAVCCSTLQCDVVRCRALPCIKESNNVSHNISFCGHDPYRCQTVSPLVNNGTDTPTHNDFFNIMYSIKITWFLRNVAVHNSIAHSKRWHRYTYVWCILIQYTLHHNYISYLHHDCTQSYRQKW